MRILYVFPHPDDESFGPARGIAAHVRDGHEVHLLTLTRGGATKERHRFGYTVEEMGAVRQREMECVARELGLQTLTVLDLPDGGLKDLDPAALETTIENHVVSTSPDVVVTYPVQGISGFADHLVTHAAVVRVYRRLKSVADQSPGRLAFVALTEDQAAQGPGVHRLFASSSADIDCVQTVREEDMERFRAALDCYETYRTMIERTGVKEMLDRRVAYEFYDERFDPPVRTLCAGMAGRG
ncbi:MAG: PIG-L family deacetylase [Candidatus Bipolaricaulota bacterium]|nr:MAG: PIG-L family deacetylase [Candidatus Bipolaricaulota bacterium]